MTRTRWLPILGAVVGLGLALVILFVMRGCDRSSLGPLIEGPIDTLPDQPMADERPEPRPTSLGRRLTTTRVPTHVTVSAGFPDSTRAIRFAKLALTADSLRHLVDSLKRARAAGDTTAHPERVRRARAILPTVAGKYDGATVRLWFTRSDGSIMRATARVKPRWEFYSGFDAGTDTAAAINGDRFWLRLARQSWKCVKPAAVLGGVGAAASPDDRLGGGLVTGGLVLLGCVLGN